MINCPKCGTPNPDNAKFCSRCGAPISTDTAPLNTEQAGGDTTPFSAAPNPYSPTPEKNSGGSKWIYIIGGAVIAILVVVLLWVNLRGGEKEPATVDSVAVIPEIIEVTESAVTETPAVEVTEEGPYAVPAEEKEDKQSDKFVGSGTIEGYPFSISGKWNGNQVTGTYTNEYNGVKMKVSGYEVEGVLELTLTAGKETCYFTFDDLGDGNYSGTFNHGQKRADFHLR